MFMIGGCAGSGAAPSENRPLYDATAPWKICRRPFRREIYGSRTTCFFLRHRDTLLIVDQGLGVDPISEYILDMLQSEGTEGTTIHFFQTHYHEDHLEGLRANSLFFHRGLVLRFYSPELMARTQGRCPTSMPDVLRSQFCETYWPVTLEMLDQIGARREHVQFSPGDTLKIDSIVVKTMPLKHPGGCTGLRFEIPGRRSVVIATDFEPGPVIDPAVVDFFGGSDLLVADMQYRDEEYEGAAAIGRVAMPRAGWGHGTPRHLLPLIIGCQVKPKCVRITHHEPRRSDMELRLFYEHTVNLLEDWHADRLFDYEFAHDGDIYWI
jgi:glyoxylase-like metal-dependent hydrolase (beta-lactamase superfamily II)